MSGAARASLGAGRMWAWRAHAYGPGGGELRLEAARMPVLRAPDHLLVRVRATSINPLDVAMLDGYGSRVLNTLRRLEGDEGVEFPLVCGRDFVGDVYRAGPAARLRPAHRVWGVLPPHHPGAHAQYVLVKDAWVGCAGEQCAQALQYGAVRALDRHAGDYGHQLVQCGPYEAIVDCAGLGGEEASARAWGFNRYATLTTPLLRRTDAAGLIPGTVRAAATLLRQCVAAANTSTRRSSSVCPPHVRWAYFMPHAGDMRHLRLMADRGLFKVQVERVFPWWEANEAYRRAADGHARGKIVIDFNATPPHDTVPTTTNTT